MEPHGRDVFAITLDGESNNDTPALNHVQGERTARTEYAKRRNTSSRAGRDPFRTQHPTNRHDGRYRTKAAVREFPKPRACGGYGGSTAFFPLTMSTTHCGRGHVDFSDWTLQACGDASDFNATNFCWDSTGSACGSLSWNTTSGRLDAFFPGHWSSDEFAEGGPRAK